MMIRFKDFVDGLSHSEMDHPSVKVITHQQLNVLYLRFNSKDILEKACYSGPINPWIGSMCSLANGKSLSELLKLDKSEWLRTFSQDQMFCELYNENDEQFFFRPVELLKAGLDVYRGREYLYQESEPLICRCFGIRENDVLSYVRSSSDPTPEGLAESTKAGMGCRSCVGQLRKWLSIQTKKSRSHFYKEKSYADWLIEIDYMLSCFPEALDWKMEVAKFQGLQVTIQFKKEVSQREEEDVAIRLQDFLGAALDSDLSFFLIRA
jgi:bacterioferritin-associated ferredoxin